MQQPQLFQRKASLGPGHCTIRTIGGWKPSAPGHRQRCDPPRAGGGGLDESVLARLKAAEDEAARLRKELQEAQKAAGKVASSSQVASDVIDAKPPRIDSTDARETIFANTQPRQAWLSEADVDFFTGGGVGETSSSEPEDPEAQATVRRRLLIGGALTVGLGAFALIPTEQLRLKPSKPLYVYAVPLLRSKALLGDSKELVENGEWDTVRIVLNRIRGSPNNAKENMDDIVALLSDRRAAEQGVKLAAEFIEYLEAMDYNKYFETMPKTRITASMNVEYVAFSSKALAAAQERLDRFLALLPADALADARAQVQPLL